MQRAGDTWDDGWTSPVDASHTGQCEGDARRAQPRTALKAQLDSRRLWHVMVLEKMTEMGCN